MKYWNKICGFVIIFFLWAFFGVAQTTKNTALFASRLSPLKISSLAVSFKNQNVNAPTISLHLIAPNYYTQNFGFVCKKELALHKAIKTTLFVRLGSLQQCNYLEGKK